MDWVLLLFSYQEVKPIKTKEKEMDFSAFSHGVINYIGKPVSIIFPDISNLFPDRKNSYTGILESFITRSDAELKENRIQVTATFKNVEPIMFYFYPDGDNDIRFYVVS